MAHDSTNGRTRLIQAPEWTRRAIFRVASAGAVAGIVGIPQSSALAAQTAGKRSSG